MGLISMVLFLKELIHKLGISAQLNAVLAITFKDVKV
jgi:hypothetical protein